VDNSSSDEVLHIPSILMVPGGCSQTSLFPGLPVYLLLVCLDGLNENISLERFLMPSDKGLVGIPYSTSSFGLASYPSKISETLSVLCIGHSTFVPS
jgi:hypothetical protein